MHSGKGSFPIAMWESVSLADTQEKFDNSGTGKKPCIVMIGAPRTGTTLLANVLGAHPRIAMLDEEFHGAARFVIGNKISACYRQQNICRKIMYTKPNPAQKEVAILL